MVITPVLAFFMKFLSIFAIAYLPS